MKIKFLIGSCGPDVLLSLHSMPMDLPYLYRDLFSIEDPTKHQIHLMDYEVRIVRIRFAARQTYIWIETKRLKAIVDEIRNKTTTML